jgi:hypothetical protein
MAKIFLTGRNKFEKLFSRNYLIFAENKEPGFSV